LGHDFIGFKGRSVSKVAAFQRAQRFTVPARPIVRSGATDELIKGYRNRAA
jgi:hypothetical protein